MQDLDDLRRRVKRLTVLCVVLVLGVLAMGAHTCWHHVHYAPSPCSNAFEPKVITIMVDPAGSVTVDGPATATP